MNFRAIHRNKISIPLKTILQSDIVLGNTLLDYGCGHGKDVKHLNNLGYSCIGFDPNVKKYQTEPKTKMNAIFLTYVLCVISEYTDRLKVLKKTWSLLDNNGWLFVSTRTPSDTISSKGEKWKEFNDGFLTSIGTFQGLIPASNLKDMILNITGGLDNIKELREMHQRSYFLFAIQKK